MHKQRLKDALSVGRERAANHGAERHGLRELHAQSGNDAHEPGVQTACGHGEFVWIARLGCQLQFARKQLLFGDLEHVVHTCQLANDR